MLRISHTETPDAPDRLFLRVEGDVRGRWVEELRKACDEMLTVNAGSATPILVLDLAGVLFIDAGGLALFRELTARRVEMTNCSPFIAEQLKGAANGPC